MSRQVPCSYRHGTPVWNVESVLSTWRDGGFVPSAAASPVGRVRGWLPSGRPLDEKTWAERHRTVVRLLWLHVI